MLVFWAAVCLVAAVLVVFGWRRYRRVNVGPGARRRREMRAEVESIRQLLHGKLWTTDDALVSVPVVFHPATRLHNPGPGHPERRERIEAVLAALRAPDLTGTVEWVEGRPAARDQLERVHSPVYLDALERVAHGGGGALDADTVMSRDSWDAALAAAGVAIARWSRESSGARPSAPRALRAPRPRGRAMGFCLINNVVVAARHAQERGRPRVLIVDWDVHPRGNGTQALVERDPSIRYVSMHQYPWYPGTGAEDERGVGNVFNVPRPPGLAREVYARTCSRPWTPPWSGGGRTSSSSRRGFDSLAGDPLGGFTLEPADRGALDGGVSRARRAGAGRRCAGRRYRLDLLAAGARAHVRALA